MTTVLIVIAIVLVLWITRMPRHDYGEAEIQYAYGKTHRYRARRDNQTGKIQIFVREWMPAQPPGRDDVKVTFTKTDHD